jgi:hypothetical protein
MTKYTLTALAATFFMLAGASAHSASLTKAEYASHKAAISAQYKATRAACKTSSGNAKDICIEEAKGQKKIATAQLEADYQPSDKHQFDVRIAKAEAAYAVAKEKCDDAAGNVKDVCLKEATSAQVTAKANATVIETTLDANTEARAKASEAVKGANSEKRHAAYGVAKEKCDALAGDVKAKCIQTAKVEFGLP